MKTLWIRGKSSASRFCRPQHLPSEAFFHLGAVPPTHRQGWLRPLLRRSQRRSYVAQAGFSLVELLVVTGILAIAMAAVMGTLSVALQTNRNNSALVEANNNVRAVINFIKNDLDNVSEPPLTSVLLSTSGNPVNPFLGARAVYVRGGFLAARGFPVGSGSQAPSRIGNVPPRLNAGTITTNCDILSPIQAWTAVTNGALSQGTFASPALVANQGYADTAGTSAATRYPDLRLYPGACDRTEVTTAYGNGSHQLITLQTNPVPVALNVNVPDPNNPNQTITRQQIFQVENTYEAIAQVSGGTLTLVPLTAGSSDVDFPAGTTFNLRPSRLAPNRVESNPFVNPDDRYLARRLRPFVDTLLLTYQFVPPNNGNPTWLSFLGLVTAINDDNSIVLGPDLAGINSQWSGLIQNNRHVTITRMRLSHYFVGWNGIQNGVASPPVLYYREGGLLSPLAFDIENLRLSFTLADEELVLPPNNTPVHGALFTTSDIGGPINLPTGAVFPPVPVGAVPINAPRSPLTTKTQIRMVTITVYGRSAEQERSLIRADAAIPDAFNRGYFHVSERTTVGLRNLAPR